MKMLCFRSFPQEGDKSHDITDRTFDRTSLVRCSVILGQEKCLEQFTIRYWMLQLKICIAKTHLVQNFAMKVRLVFQNEITDWTFVESLNIISKLKFFQTLDQSLPRNSF